MPAPTREQYEAAAKKVAQSAPQGLSRDDFYALVDKELGVSTYKPDASISREAMARAADPTRAFFHKPSFTDELGNPVDSSGKPLQQGAVSRFAGHVAEMGDSPVANLVSNLLMMGATA